MRDNLGAALSYAALGFRVFPLHAPNARGCDCNRAGCPSPAKHPRNRNGLTDATTDTAQIEAWWQMWPHANIGVAAGPESGIFALDIDPRDGGDAELRELTINHGLLPFGLAYETGSGGEHYWFRHPGRKVTSHKLAGQRGIDVKGDGGYLVVPASVHVTGASYAFYDGIDVTTAIPDAPAWLLAMLDETPALDTSARQVADVIPAGDRNSTLAREGGALRRRGHSQARIFKFLMDLNEEACNPPLAATEVAQIAASVARYEPTPEVPVIVDIGTRKNGLGPPPEPFKALGVDEWLGATDDDDLDVILSDGGDGAVLPRDGKLAIAAGPGVAKTNMLMRFGRSAVEGGEWLRLPFARPVRVLHFATEGSKRGYRKRGRKIWDGASDEVKERYRWMHGSPLNIVEDVIPLGDLVLDHRADVLIIDLLRNAHSLDENDSRQMAQLAAALDALIARCQCAVVLAHHDRKAHPLAKTFDGIDSVRGSTAFTGWLSACLSVRKKPRVQDVLLADWVKVRDAEEALPPLELEFLRSTIDFKVSTRSAELDVRDLVLTAVFHNGELTKAEIVAIVSEQGSGKRMVAETVVALATEGKLYSWVKPEHAGKHTKTYRVPNKQQGFEEYDDDE